MSPSPAPLAPDSAWLPLPPDQWDAAHARHLLRRTGWSAQLADVTRAVDEGLENTLNRLFPTSPLPWAPPARVTEFENEVKRSVRELADGPEVDRRRRRNALRQHSRDATQALGLDWLQVASQPERSAFEKWVHFLSDIYVTSEQKVRQAHLLHRHQATLRRNALGPAPELTKAVSRSPAMVLYLDLQQSQRDAPNENFARELFELFVLGEGNYTENDVKEAARAFTGYRQRFGVFAELPRQTDTEPKTLFGRSGRFDGDEVIDLAYGQPAAATFLPGEMVRFYLTTEGLEPALLAPLGDWWREHAFNLRDLALRFFGSRAFFHPSWRGNYIKSPAQFYLGLLQDLDLAPLPLPRFTLNALRGMGQNLFDPPNVRGWVGGRHWINSTTLAVRRQTVALVLNGVPTVQLNADEVAVLEQANRTGTARFSLPETWFEAHGQGDPEAIAARWMERFLPRAAPAAGRKALASLLGTDDPDRQRTALVAVFSTPDYNFC